MALGVLVAAGFGLRLAGIDQTLYADEYFTHTIVTENGLGGVWDQVYHTSITPPLHYFLAWLSVQFGGDSTVLVRLPSLILGTATIPLVFLLGRRVAGSAGGLLAAALMALSPFAIWYADEGRAYATMMFLVALSTLALLRALEEDGRRGWWAVFAVSACAAMWSHYTAFFVIVAQIGWAAWTHRDRLRPLAFASAAIGIGYLPWVPGFLEQRQNDVGIEVIDVFAPITVGRVFELPLRTLVGHPFVLLRDSPGPVGLVPAAVLALLVVAAALKPIVLRRLVESLAGERGLIAILALATPVGLLLYAAVDSSLYLPRNLAASLPALTVFAAFLLVSLAEAVPRRAAAVAAGAFVVALAVAAVDSVTDDDQRRPAYREAAHYLDDVADPADPVVDTPLQVADQERFRKKSLDLYFDKEHPLYAAGPGQEGAWRQLRDGRNVYLVASTELAPKEYAKDLLGGAEPPPGLVRRLTLLGGPDGRAVRRDEEPFPSIFPISVFRFKGVADGRLERTRAGEVISWKYGRDIRVAPGVARGAVEAITPRSEPLAISGWALQARRPELVDWVLFFSNGRLFAASPGGLPRPEIAKAFGASALLSGFLRAPTAPVDRSTVRVFAVVGDRASELPLSPALRRTLGRATAG